MSATVPLGGGASIPLLGFGTYQIKNADAAVAVSTALNDGYRHVDTAEGYKNEEAVGAAIRAFLQREGLTRGDVFVTTKLWPGNAAWRQAPKTRQTTISSLEASLSRLGLDYVDLYLIHAPFHPEHRLDQWRGMMDLRASGKARAIGVSNFSVAHLEQMRAAGLEKPAANQIELHPWSQKPELVAYLRRHGITPIAYSSLVPLATWRVAEGQRSAKTARMQADSASPRSPFRLMAAKYGVSEAQVLLRWAVQQGWPVLPKSVTPERIRQNADLFGFTIDAGDMAAIARMDRGDGVAWGAGDPTRAP